MAIFRIKWLFLSGGQPEDGEDDIPAAHDRPMIRPNGVREGCLILKERELPPIERLNARQSALGFPIPGRKIGLDLQAGIEKGRPRDTVDDVAFFAERNLFPEKAYP